MKNSPLLLEIGKVDLITGIVSINFSPDEYWSISKTDEERTEDSKIKVDIFQHECFHFMQLISYSYLFDICMLTFFRLQRLISEQKKRNSLISVEELKQELQNEDIPKIFNLIGKKQKIGKRHEFSCRDILESQAILSSYKSNYTPSTSDNFIAWAKKMNYEDSIQAYLYIDFYYGDLGFDMFSEIVFWSFNTSTPLETFDFLVKAVGKVGLINSKKKNNYYQFQELLRGQDFEIYDTFYVRNKFAQNNCFHPYLDKYIKRLSRLNEKKFDEFYLFATHPYSTKDATDFMPGIMRLKSGKVVMFNPSKKYNETTDISQEDIQIIYALSSLYGAVSFLKGDVSMPYIQCHHIDCPHYLTNLCVSNKFIPKTWDDCSFPDMLKDYLKLSLINKNGTTTN